MKAAGAVPETGYAVDFDSVERLRGQWQSSAVALAQVDQALERARVQADRALLGAPSVKPTGLPLFGEALHLLDLARRQADQLLAELNADIVRLDECAFNYRATEEDLAARLNAVRGGTPTPHPYSGPQAPAGLYANQAKVTAWINEAFGDLEAAGVPDSALDEPGVLTIIEHESSGDPNAVNNWDSNAAAGHPSRGLMQTIDSTFEAYKLPGHGDVYNPVDNIIAGVRYALSRYGSISEVPGVKAVNSGGSYVGY